MSFTCLNYHLVFATKERRPMLQGESLVRTSEYIGGIARKIGGDLLLGGGQPDHVHLLASIPPTMAVSDFLRDVKANSSGWIRDELPDLGAFGWQDGYAAFTVSPSLKEKVKRYIRSQAEHHRKMTFEEELILFLEKHEIPYDPRYLLR